MKKWALAFMAIIYMGISSGIAMEIHYCMGKLAGAEFYGKKDDKCGKCGMKDKKDCCSDEYKFYKLSDSHKKVSTDFLINIPVPTLVPLGIPVDSEGYAFYPGEDAFKHLYPPPRYPASLETCRMNCIFRI